MDVKHKPNFKINQAVKEISAREGVPVKYVVTTDLISDNKPIDVFYRDTPHPKFGNKYFGLYYSNFKESVMICDADKITDMTFAMILDEANQWHYSQSRHDYVRVGNKFVDGGRAYVRSDGSAKLFRVVDGEFVECK